MIVQWIKLHPSFMDETPSMYGDVLSSRTQIGVVKTGNKLEWQRENLYKCIEYTGTMWIEHIVMINSVKAPVVPLVSKYIETKIFAYSHTYTAGIKNLADANYITSPNTEPIGKSVYELVVEKAHSEYSWLPNIMYDWQHSHPSADKIAPVHYASIFGSVDDVLEEWSIMLPKEFDRAGMAPYINNQVKNPVAISFVEDISSSIYENLSELFESVKNGYDQQRSLYRTMTALFAPWEDRYPAVSTIANRKSFVKGDASCSEMTKFQDLSLENETLRTFPMTEYPNIDWSHCDVYVPPDYTKELVSFIEFIQAINLTDFDMSFDFDRMERSIYECTSYKAINRYYTKTDVNGILFPYMQEDESATSYAYGDYTKDIGQAVCDYLITNLPEAFENYTSVRIIKTYNEDLLLYFENIHTPDKVAVYIDLIAYLLCGQNMSKIQYSQPMAVSI